MFFVFLKFSHRVALMFVYDFRCPLCKAISTLDLPVLDPLLKQIPSNWLHLRLLAKTIESCSSAAAANSTLSPGRQSFQVLSSWLGDLRRWLEYTPDTLTLSPDQPDGILVRVSLLLFLPTFFLIYRLWYPQCKKIKRFRYICTVHLSVDVGSMVMWFAEFVWKGDLETD